MVLILKSNTRATINLHAKQQKQEHYSPKLKFFRIWGMRACFGSFEKPRGKILRNHSISLQARSDSEMEDKPPSTYAPLSTISISSLL